MSLEQALAENTAALNKLHQALSQAGITAEQVSDDLSTDTEKPKKPKAEKKAKKAKGDHRDITHEDIRDLWPEIKKNVEDANAKWREILASVGVKRNPDIKKKDLAAVYAKGKELLAGAE